MSGFIILWFHAHLSLQHLLPWHSAHISLLTKFPCSDFSPVGMRFDIHKGHFPIKIPYLLLSELFRSDLCRGDIVFSEKDQAGSWVHLPAAATLPRCPLWCRYQLMHFIREVLVLSSFLSASCSGGAARYQVWPANIPASGAKAL